MKGKKLLSILAVLMVWLLVASSALAVTIDHDTSEVYGEGDAIVVRGSDDGSKTTVNDFDDDVTGYNIYGGSKDADVTGDTSVTIGEGAVVGDVYGGGNNGDVDGDTNVVILDGATTGDVYGGGHAEGEDANSQGENGDDAQANVTGDTNVTVSGGSTGDVYGGGHAEGGDSNAKNSKGGDAVANVEGQANVTINGGSTDDVHGGGKADKGDRNHSKAKLLGRSATANVEDTNVEVKKGTVTGDVYGGGSSTDGGWALTGNDTQVTIAGTGVVKGAVYGSGDTTLLTNVEGESRIIIEGGNIESRDVYANNTNTRIDLNDTSAFYYTYHVLAFCDDFQLLNPILEEYPLTKVGCEGLYWIYQFQGVSEPKDVEVIFQYTYNGNIIEVVTKHVTVEFFQTADKGRGVTVDSAFTGDNLYKPASGSATVYFSSSEQVTVPVELERYSRGNDDDDDDVPLNPGVIPGAEDIPLGVPSTGGLTDWSILIAALGFAGLMVVRETRRKKS